MGLVLADRVQQTGTANTTVSFTLSGSVTGFQSFAAIGNSNTTYYAAFDQSGNWETGLGTYSTTGPTLTRTTVTASSNSGSAVTFSGQVSVFVTQPTTYTVVSSNNPGTSGYALLSGGSGVAPSWGTLGTAAGGTGLTGFTAANNAIYSTSSSALTAGTLPVLAGGTGQTTYTDGQLLIGNTTGNTLTKATLTGTSNQITVTNGSGSITLSTPQSINTTASVQFGSFGVGTAASGTTGEIRATNNVTAYYSSDRSLKENIQDVPNVLEKVCAIGSKTFDWTDDYIQKHGGEDGYFVTKSSFGVIAQDVQEVFPQAVRTREDGTLAVDYEKLAVLSFGAIKELLKRVEALENK